MSQVASESLNLLITPRRRTRTCQKEVMFPTLKSRYGSALNEREYEVDARREEAIIRRSEEKPERQHEAEAQEKPAGEGVKRFSVREH